MEQSQLVELLRTLNKDEKELILQVSKLPHFNHGKMKAYVPRFLQLCLEHPWNNSSQDLDKKTIFSSLFPSQKFVEGKLDKIMVEAQKIVRSALLLRHYFRDENGFQTSFDFAGILWSKGLNVRYKSLLTRLQKLQTGVPYKNVNYFNQQVVLENSIHEFECYHNQKKGDLNVPTLLEVLEVSYHLNRLTVLNRFLLQQKTSKIEVPETIDYQINNELLPTKYLEKSPVLKISHAIFHLLRKKYPDSVDIHSLFDLLKLNEKFIDKENLQEFYSYLRSLCILVLYVEVEKIEVEYTLHELYKDNLQRGYLHYEGKLHPSRYWAVSSNALRVKHFDWAIEFIEKYKFELIGENETKDIYRLNLANYLFATGKYSESLDNIPATSPFVDYLLTGKRLEIKAYYELKSDLLPFKLEAFKVFLSRTSPKLLSETQRQNHLSFANLLTQLTNSRQGDPKRSETILKRLQEKKQAAEWRWLLEKAKELKNT